MRRLDTPGEGGISIIRISGPEAHLIMERIFRPRGNRPHERLTANSYWTIVDPADAREVDEVLAVLMAAPATYTREDIAEIHSHGGFAAQKAIMDLVMRQGARLAEPGEFTRRAFLNGRIDLVHAESVLDVIRSETDDELRYALTCLKGGLSRGWTSSGRT
jgi:tRNA modification GTPase